MYEDILFPFFRKTFMFYKLKNLTYYEPDLSISAGAAYVANSNGYSIVDENKKIVILKEDNLNIEGEIILGLYYTLYT